MEFKYANYEAGEFAYGCVVTKLIKVSSNNVSTIYITVGTSEDNLTKGHFVVVFANQPELLDLIESNPGAVFGIGFLKKENPKHSYTVLVSENERVSATTVAKAAVLVSSRYMLGRNLITKKNGTIMIV